MIGLALIAAALASWAARTWRREPGKLVATCAEIVWQAPPSEPGRGGSASAVFEVTNLGGEPVKIIATESGCGCATPIVERTSIAPREEGKIRVTALSFPIGERLVRFVLHTNSPITPRVPLHLRMIGSQRPPFLLGVKGDLSFLGPAELDAGREFAVMTVEDKGIRNDKRPILESQLPIRFDYLGTEDRPYVLPGVVLREHKYRIVFTKKPGPGTLESEVRALDPWVQGHVEKLRLYAASHPEIRVIPSSLFLSPARRDRGAETTRFVIVTADPTSEPLVEVRDAEKSPILLERPKGERSGRVKTYEVKWKSGVLVRSSRFDILVWESPLTANPIVVPVTVQGGDEP